MRGYQRSVCVAVGLFSFVLFRALAAFAADGAPAVSAAATDANGFLSHQVESPYQSDKTQIRLLLPKDREPGRRYPVVYVLPTEARAGTHDGDGLVEIKQLELQNKRKAIFVAPTFSQMPWYADHPTDRAIRQESYFLDVVVPFVEKNYPADANRNGRLLLGFSKSGWGAWSLLLRHPDVFGRAVAWDAPLTMNRLGPYETPEIFGTQENFEKYRIPDLLRTSAANLGDDKRLILIGFGIFRRHHTQVHDLLLAQKIPHEYRDGPERRHDWRSGWLSEAVELLTAVDSPAKSSQSGETPLPVAR